MDLQSHRSELGEWRSGYRPAHPALRAFVKGYFASSSCLPGPVRERLLPSVEVPLVLNFGAPHRRLDGAETPEWTSRDGAWIVGLHDRPQLSEAVGERKFMIVGFTPLGAHHFLRTSMDLVRGRALDLQAIDGKLATQVVSRAGAAGHWGARFDAIETLIAERVAHAAPRAGFAFVWDKLEATDGRASIGVLASKIECSHRALIDQFRVCAGATPKKIGRLLRFNRAIRSLDAAGGRSAENRGEPYIQSETPGRAPALSVPWADVAADCGYADQAHFIKEFRQFAGASPTEFVRSMADIA